MMLHGEIQGVHTPGDGNGMTIQELLDFLRSIPKSARGNYLMIATTEGVEDLTEVQVAQSDQADKWEFKFYLSSRLSGTTEAVEITPDHGTRGRCGGGIE